MKGLKLIGALTLAATLACCCACSEGDGKDAWTGRKVTDSGYVETFELEDCSLGNEPTVVCDLTSSTVLELLKSSTYRPSNTIVRFSKNFNVLDEAGKKLDNFANIYNNVLKGKTIPVLYLENEECAEAAVEFMTERMEIADMAIMSPVPAAVKTVRDAFPFVRGILSYETLESPVGVARTANACKAATVVIPQSAASAENVGYIQARFKSVWVKADSCDDVDIYDCMGSGAYGIIGSEFQKVYSLMSDCAKGVTRMPFNVGHRGIPSKYHENSASGAHAAASEGATHVELDGHLSADGHIVMMHNADLGATTNGRGNIAEMTLEEIRQFQLNRKGELEQIPILEDIMEALKGTDCVLVFEIKGGGKALIEKLKPIVEEYDFAEQMVIISFAADYIEKVNEILPEIPTALLANSMNEDSIDRYVRLNTGIDVNTASMTQEFEKFYKDRGMMGWYWTFGSVGQMIEAAENGFVGLTVDNAAGFAYSGEEEAVRFVRGAVNTTAASAPRVGEKIQLKCVSYRGREVVRTGTVRFVLELNDKYAVVAACDRMNESAVYAPRLYSKVFYLNKE